MTGKTNDASPTSSPYKASWLRRAGTLCAIAVLKRVRKRYSGVLFLTRGLCVKYGKDIDLAEAATLNYVRGHTSIPVAKVHCAFQHGDATYILMERLPGQKLAHGWTQRSVESQQNILSQLKGMVNQMRDLKPPHGSAVANVDGGSLTDPRLPGLGLAHPVQTSTRFGPFEDVKAFHRWLRRPAYDRQDDNFAEVNDLIAFHEDTEWGMPVFIHGDLSSLNILADGDTVTGIVDWETAGWYPAYWEYTTAMQVNFKNEFWKGYIDDFIEPRPDDLRMESIRQKYFGDT